MLFDEHFSDRLNIRAELWVVLAWIESDFNAEVRNVDAVFTDASSKCPDSSGRIVTTNEKLPYGIRKF
jgi:hypothetical protein